MSLTFSGKRSILTLVVLVAAGVGLFFALRKEEPAPEPVVQQPATQQDVIGTSVEGRPIETYTYGDGDTRLLFVGGIHGGYEWNSVLLAYQFVDYLAANPSFIPENLTVAVIPSLNPDGVFTVTGKEGRFTALDVNPDATIQADARFNAREVDLNRNFDCKWQPTSTWRSQEVSAGTAPFSEPEAAALRDYIATFKPNAVVFWHSQSNAVYASECESGILPQTLSVMNTYSAGSGYPAVSTFDAYTITGDAEGWLASQGIPAVTVELSTHETIEWERNLAGVKKLFELYPIAK